MTSAAYKLCLALQGLRRNFKQSVLLLSAVAAQLQGVFHTDFYYQATFVCIGVWSLLCYAIFKTVSHTRSRTRRLFVRGFAEARWNIGKHIAQSTTQPYMHFRG